MKTKLKNFTKYLQLYRNDYWYYFKNTVHNFSLYVLSSNAELALAYGLEQNILVKLNKHTIKTEFEVFYQSLIQNISHIPENDISLIKAKLRSTYEKYSNVYVPYEYRRIVESLSKNDNTVIMKPDKGRGFVIMDKLKYTKKCLEILNTKQFSKTSVDLTKKTEAKIQRVLRKIKTNLRSRNTILYTLHVLVLENVMVPLRLIK